ncbi:MAG: Ig-like domain-containing protein, partial [Bradymonadaceae bacterium]
MNTSRRLSLSLVHSSLLLALVGLVAGPACGGESKKTPNRPPTIDSVSAEKRTVDPGSSVTVKVVASDPDGPSSDGTGLASGLTATWTTDDDAWTIDAEGGSATVTAPESYESWSSIRVAIRDGEGATAHGEVQLTTGANAGPRLLAMSAKPNPVAPEGTVELTAEATDARGDELTYEWSAPDGWNLESSSGKSVQLTAPVTEGAS